MSYTKQTWATGDTVTATKLNHMEDGIEGAGGGGYDLVLVAETDDGDISQITAADITIASGSIEACEQKIANTQPVNVFFGIYRTYGESATAPNILYYLANPPIINEFCVAYKYMDWNYNPRITYTSNYEIDEVIWD